MLPSPLHYFVSVIWLQAYKTLVDKEGTEGALPGVGLTEDQLFFVGFARVSIRYIYAREAIHLGNFFCWKFRKSSVHLFQT